MSAQVSMIPVRKTERLVDALNEAVELDSAVESRTEFLLHRLQALLDRQTRCALLTLDQLARQPVPLISTRSVVRPAFDDAPVVTIQDVQRALEDSAPLSQPLLARVMAHIRTPVTMVASEVGDAEWFQNVLVKRYLAPMGYADCMTSMWAASEDRAIMLLCHRRAADRAFSEQDLTLMSLMLRAAAPIVDRAMFNRGPSDLLERLSEREREILLLLLAGDSEKEIAAHIHRSVHTVHTFVQRLYRLFEVSSRGELMALFVDKAALDSIRDSLPS